MTIEEGRAATDSTPASDALEAQLWERFATFIPVYRRWVSARLKEYGIGYAWMRALGVLYGSDGPMIMSNLGAELGVTPRNVTKLVDELVAAGYVRREPHPSDRRAILIALTDAGRAKIAQGRADYVAATTKLFAALSPDDQGELMRLMDLLAAQLEVQNNERR